MFNRTCVEEMQNGIVSSRESYAKVFAEIRAGHDLISINVQTLQQIMDKDPKNAMFIYNEALDISRNFFKYTLEAMPLSASTTYITCVINSGVRDELSKYIEKLDTYTLQKALESAIKQLNGKLYNFHQPISYFILGACIGCGTLDTLSPITVQSLNFRRAIPISRFDMTETTTVRSIQAYCRAYMPKLENCFYSGGLCKVCWKHCVQCGLKMPMHNVTYDILDGYLQLQTCPECGSGSIVKLPAPKPNPKELRGYRNKFKTFGKEV